MHEAARARPYGYDMAIWIWDLAIECDTKHEIYTCHARSRSMRKGHLRRTGRTGYFNKMHQSNLVFQFKPAYLAGILPRASR